MPKYLSRLRKISFFLIDRSSAISVESNKASSKVKATWHPIHPLKFLSYASSLRGSPCSMGAGSQTWGSSGRLSPLSTPLSEVWSVFCYLVAFWLSSSCSAWDFPVSTTSLPFYSLFLLGSAESSPDGKDGWGGGGRGDLGGGGGSLGWVDFPGAPLPGWDSIKSSKLLWFFLWIPISSEVITSTCCWSTSSADVFSGDRGWLNASNLSEEFDKTKAPSGCSSSSFSLSPSFSRRTGWDEDAFTAGVPTKSGWVNGVPLGMRIPSGTMNPSWATLMRWSRRSLAFITHLGAWNAKEMGVYPRIMCATRNWPSASFTKTSDRRILSKLSLLTNLSRGLVECLSAKLLK